MSDPSVFQPGHILTGGATRYEIRELLGSGGYGRVYRAKRHIVLGTRSSAWDVAIKVTHGSGGFRSAAVAEATALATLRCPQIVPLLDVFELDDGRVALVMPLIRAPRGMRRPDLGSGRRSSDTPWLLSDQALMNAGLAIARALRWAHRATLADDPDTGQPCRRKAIVHLDIKPQNILVSEDSSFLLADFGLGVEVGEIMDGRVRGTPGYKAPEVDAEGYLASPEADIYSLGVTLWELGVGDWPPATSRERRQIWGRVRSAADGFPHRGLHDLIAQMLDPAPALRPTAAHCVKELRGFYADYYRGGGGSRTDALMIWWTDTRRGDRAVERPIAFESRPPRVPLSPALPFPPVVRPPAPPAAAEQPSPSAAAEQPAPSAPSGPSLRWVARQVVIGLLLAGVPTVFLLGLLWSWLSGLDTTPLPVAEDSERVTPPAEPSAPEPSAEPVVEAPAPPPPEPEDRPVSEPSSPADEPDGGIRIVGSPLQAYAVHESEEQVLSLGLNRLSPGLWGVALVFRDSRGKEVPCGLSLLVEPGRTRTIRFSDATGKCTAS